MPAIWNAYADTPFPWERDALEFVRERFPEREPYRAWSLFEFIALDGSVNEIDLLVFAPYGFFLIEIKSRPGRVTGDAGTWTWHTDGRLTSTDNPLKLANTKAKKLAALLAEQPAAKRGGRVPFIEPLIFLSAPNLHCDLTGTGRLRVCLRDREASDAGPARPGIMAAIRRRECAGLEALSGRAQLDRPTAKLVARAMEQAGIVASNRERRMSDYGLTHQIDEGRAAKGSTRTNGWVPAFFSQWTLADLGRLAVLEHVLSGNRFDGYAGPPSSRASERFCGRLPTRSWSARCPTTAPTS